MDRSKRMTLYLYLQSPRTSYQHAYSHRVITKNAGTPGI